MELTQREARFLTCVLTREHSRKELGGLVGSLNVCDVKFRLIKKGLDIVCKRKPIKDRDGKTTRPGYYSIPESGRKLALKLLASARTLASDKSDNKANATNSKCSLPQSDSKEVLL